MPDPRTQLADALQVELGIRRGGLSTWANHIADVLLSLPGIAIVELPEPNSTGRHSLDDDRIEDGRYVMWFDNGVDCPWVGCAHGWIRSGKAAAVSVKNVSV